ncbi:MAG: ParB/RepB/Spo0J family partition protein [Candidatus Kapaibacterium sp.]
MKTHGLGKGLGALIPKQEERVRPAAENTGAEQNDNAVLHVELTKIRPNRFQPRVDFDPVALEELASSIREKGVIQPVTVRSVPGGYELVAGERRVRASIEAGKSTIPAYVVDVDTDADMLELAIIENVQRENLNPIEVALGYERLIAECGLSQEDVAEKVGKDRSTVTNFLRLLKLGAVAQEALRTRALTMGHARALLAITGPEIQDELVREIGKRQLSVRATEQLVKDIVNGKSKEKSKDVKTVTRKTTSGGDAGVSSTLTDIESHLRTVFATQVHVRTKSETGAGSIEIDFYSLEDLERLLELLAAIEHAQNS